VITVLDTHGDMPAALDDWQAAVQDCHSVVLRLPAGIDTCEVWGNLDRVALQRPEYRNLRLWERSAPTGSDCALREAGRPITPIAGIIRLVLVHHRDSASELVVVARRSRINQTSLIQLANLLAGYRSTLDGVRSSTAPRSRWPQIPWGLGDQCELGTVGTLSVSVALGNEVVLVGATALTLARYDVAQQPRIAIGDLFTVTPYEVDEDATVADYLARLASDAAVSSSAAGEQVGEQQGGPVGIMFGVARDGYEYRPCLSPLFPLTFYWEQLLPDGSWRGRCWYDRGLVSPAIAERFAAHVALAARWLATADAQQLLADIPLMTHEEQNEILRKGVTESVGSPGPLRIDQLFAEVSRQQCNAPAISESQTTVSYGELDALADRMAAGLHVLGVSPSDRVGVCLERGVAMVAAFLAVLKLDCAYVPMDLQHPHERLRYLVNDSGVSMMIAVESFPDVDGVRRATPAELERAGAHHAKPAGGSSDCPAYAVYTSGSTSRPKGVLVRHSSVTALIQATAGEFALRPDDVWSFFHSSAFDFSVWEIWGCLLTGGHLVVVPYWVSRAPEEFRELLIDSRVTVLSQTPSAFGQLIDADGDALGGGLRSVRLVVLGGESLDAPIIARWFTRYSPADCRVVNMFGITETTVHVTVHTVTSAEALRGSRKVGRALPGWSISVRDERGRVVPFGVEGEIWVGGAGVALGYLGRPELTGQTFIVDPVTALRIYRSSDNGRLHPDGDLEHLGRRDGQLKVRGHRIELEEIRGVLLEDPQVAQAAVAVVQNGADTASVRIDAYAVMKPGATAQAVLRRARLMLPDYMVPATLTEVQTMPLTINGKVDFGQLPPPAVTAGVERDMGPATDRADPMADEVLELWSRHLRTKVAISDNFFELGGNSLLVVRVLAELRSMGLPKVTLPQFYHNSTAAQFAALLQQLGRELSRRVADE
jgi:amino acid adenylation domain-containing protein